MSQFRSLPEMFFGMADRYGRAPRYLAKRSGAYHATSWTECRRNVEETASGLLDLGLQPEDRVAILSATCPEWTEVDLAALAVGCVTIPIYPSNLASECGYILHDSGARTVFVEDRAQAEKVNRAIEEGIEVGGARLTVGVEHVIVFSGTSGGHSSLADLRVRGRAYLAANRDEITRRTAALHPEKLATIVYTSGTTGLPKGVVQTHGNHLATLAAVGQAGLVQPGEIDFAYLPLAHSFGRMMEYLGIYLGTVTALAEKIDTVAADLVATRPHFMPSVPRILEKIYAGVQQARDQGSGLTRRIFDWAVAVGRRRAEYVNRGAPVPAMLALQDRLAHELVFSKIHARLGGRMRYLISGGAPLAPEINEFFHAVGLPVLEGYGLTETTPILTCNLPGRTRIGTVGLPLPGVTLKLAEDGEILAKGPNVAVGYYRRPQETAESWDSEGWFHTGDIGTFEDGFLRITDRKKELIKTAGGKYVAPQKIENMLKSRPLISQAVVIGDRLKYCVALIALDPDAGRAWAKNHGIAADSPEALAANERIVAAVAREVDHVNQRLASYESIKYFRLLPCELSVENGELTPSLKLKRKVIAEKYSDLVADLARG